ncbi:MAG: DUF2589 domain-containing protein [Candidatus Entotheonellia bacterium]
MAEHDPNTPPEAPKESTQGSPSSPVPPSADAVQRAVEDAAKLLAEVARTTGQSIVDIAARARDLAPAPPGARDLAPAPEGTGGPLIAAGVQTPPSPFGAELASLDFSQLIGGPMQAAIKAQAASANTTLEFIENFAVDGSGGQAKLRTVDFTYKDYTKKDDGSVEEAERKLTVPMISLVPIPFLRIEQMTIDLAVKLNQITKNENVNTNVFKAGVDGKYLGCSFNVSVSNTNVNTRADDVTRDYSMNVHVTAVQDSMPGGLSKMLNIFENVITQQAHVDKK